MSKKVPLHVVEKLLRHSRKLCGRVCDKILAPKFEIENSESLLQLALHARLKTHQCALGVAQAHDVSSCAVSEQRAFYERLFVKKLIVPL